MPYALVRADSIGPEQVAVALTHSAAYDGGHLGLVFHTAKDGGAHILHLAWHQRLQLQAIPQELRQCWLLCALDIPRPAAKQVVAFIRAVAAKGSRISYGTNFLAAYGSFSPNGSYKAPKGSDGLTCASFVVEVLRGASINLVKLDTWEPSPKNIQWGNRVCEDLLNSGVDGNHVDAVRKNLNGLRLRPFEAAAAAEMGPKLWAVDYGSVQAPADAVEAHLNLTCPKVA